MTGHEPIIALRRAGKRPATVLLTDDPNMVREGSTVHIAQSENPDLLDLRFIVGVTVQIDGFDWRWIERMAVACERAEAGRVLCHLFNRHGLIQRMTDTQGVMQWPR